MTDKPLKLRCAVNCSKERFANFVKETRLSMNLSQAKFGKRIGISQQVVASWERGQIDPSKLDAENYSKLAKIKGITENQLKSLINKDEAAKESVTPLSLEQQLVLQVRSLPIEARARIAMALVEDLAQNASPGLGVEVKKKESLGTQEAGIIATCNHGEKSVSMLLSQSGFIKLSNLIQESLVLQGYNPNEPSNAAQDHGVSIESFDPAILREIAECDLDTLVHVGWGEIVAAASFCLVPSEWRGNVPIIGVDAPHYSSVDQLMADLSNGHLQGIR